MFDDGPSTILVPARRILVVDDLGDVRAGDHVLMVGNVIVAHDTSRRGIEETDVESMVTRPVKSTKRIAASSKRASVKDISSERVLEIIRNNGPLTSMEISDRLGCMRGDTATRGKVTRMISFLIAARHVKRFADSRNKQFRYEADTPQAGTMCD